MVLTLLRSRMAVDLLGNEPVFGASGELMGIGGGGAYGHAVGKGLGLFS